MKSSTVSMIVFVVATLLAVGALLGLAVQWSAAAFDCDLPGLYGPDCAEVAAHNIAVRNVPIALVIVGVWLFALKFFIRERKRQK